MKKNIIIVLCVFFLSIRATCEDTVCILKIENQEQFDNLVKQIKRGQKVEAQLLPGTYFIKGILNATSGIKLSGNGSVISQANDIYTIDDAIRIEADHYICRLKSPIPSFSLFIDDAGKIIPIAESVEYVNKVNYSQTIIGDFKRAVGINLSIPIAPNLGHLKNRDFTSTYGYFDCGWRCVNFNIDKSDDRYFYITTTNAVNTHRFDYDARRGKKVRYVIFNAEEQRNTICYNDNFLSIPIKHTKVTVLKETSNNRPTITTHSDVFLKGIAFKNINGIKIHLKSSSKCFISSCTFENTLNTALSIDKKSNKNVVPAIIDSCDFFSCSLNNGHIMSLTSDIVGKESFFVSNCTLSRYGKTSVMYKNPSGALWIDGDAVVSGSKIFDTPRCHIYLNRGKITIENNILFNTESFNSFHERNLSSDFGIVYCNSFTNENATAILNANNRILIKDNVIYGAEAWQNDARGIMIDNGRGDVECRENIIYKTGIYSIDSRACAKYIGTSSIRNVFSHNIIDRKYRLQSGKDLSEKYKPNSEYNFLLGDFANIVDSTTRYNDVIVKNVKILGVENEKLVVSDISQMTMQQLPEKVRKKFKLIK